MAGAVVVTFDEIDEIMRGEENHGRRRASGNWHDLGVGAEDALEAGFEHIITVPQHGTRLMYVQGECRCEKCRAANAAYQRKRRRKGSVRPQEPFSGPEGGGSVSDGGGFSTAA